MVSQILNVVLCVAIGLLAAWGAYKKTDGNIYKKVTLLIDEMSELDIVGKEKMDRVVDKLYDMVPLPFQNLLNKAAIRDKAQEVYNTMKDFSNQENKDK